jgi:hypothetical protein
MSGSVLSVVSGICLQGVLEPISCRQVLLCYALKNPLLILDNSDALLENMKLLFHFFLLSPLLSFLLVLFLYKGYDICNLLCAITSPVI